jgi:hypothetical protein
MGKSANQAAWAEFERRDRQRQEASFEPEQPLSDDELASQYDDAYWERLDAVRRYARANCRVDIWDEMRRAA